ncbi:hypothetical protein P691DRAFT_700636 [Macrolepiota fuliginosa MF-IS2]|uniref:RING-CH-type domain-containing protein n=1 Tax=Macrolepiota fuliginosa MF-IS2 TaxID=1400762 RepID=A0A9P5XHC7_9AGAR|nr:hypothetical protein P691DRAFT_700636 [Macrolepiota fuliginosa MF-IS2]
MMSATRIPTVDDLRIKLCYICREEEPFDAVHEGPLRPWTHPCRCTLIAHESCLLQWIKSAQSNSSRAQNALKCPQCGADYELESEKSIVLNILSAGNRVLQRVGGVFTLASAASVIGVMGSGVYIMLTAYGAWAVRQYVGKEMFDVLLTDDPSNWPWTAFLNLPILPLTLISSRLSPSSKACLPTLIPILLVWPPSPVAHQWMHHEPWHKRDRPHSPRLRAWPPSPFVFGFFISPIVRIVYRKLLQRVAVWLLGANLSDVGRRGLQFNEGPFMIRIRANVRGVNRDGVEENVDLEEGPDGHPPAGANAHANQNGENANANNVAQDPNAANLEAAERQIEIRATSLGRRVGGALLIPYISNVMGSLLFRLSKHSCLLREFLGIKQHRRLLNGLPPSVIAYPSTVMGGTDGIPGLKKLGHVVKTVVEGLWGGTKTWAELDPVWWRNSIGLGLFIVAKDCLYLTHLWLAKREIESRKVKNKDFAGVDIKELDLVPSFPRPQPQADMTEASPRGERTSGYDLVGRAMGFNANR